MRVPSLCSVSRFPLVALLLLAGALWILWPLAAHAQETWHVDDSVNDGLVAYWKFDEPGMSTALPYVGTVTGTLENGASMTFGPVPPLNFTNAGVLLLDGANDRVQLADNAALNLGVNFTVAGWIQRDTTGAYHAIHDSGEQANEWWVFIAGATSGGANDNRLGFGERGIAEVYSTQAITDTVYHHIAVTKSGDSGQNITFYVDGVARGAASVGSVTFPSGVKHIGGLQDGSAVAHFDGRIDDLRVYNRALTSAEVQRLAQGDLCVTDGASWDTAFRDLHCALAVSTAGDEIWIGVGTYRPGTHPSVLYSLKNGVDILGGFTGTAGAKETSPAQRPAFDPNAPLSILSGDILGNDAPVPFGAAGLYTDNSNTVLFAQSGVTASVQGLRVQGGNARTGSGDGTRGGGLRAQIGASIALTNVSFFGNQATSQGGALFSYSPVTLAGATFASNRAQVDGGAIFIEAQLVVTDSLFLSNTASAHGGAIAVADVGGAVLTDTTVLSNTASGAGGGIYVGGSALTLANVDIVGNSASDGGGLLVSLLLDATVQTGLSITDSLFDCNRATTGSGGGAQSGQAMQVIDTDFVNNFAQVGGGGLYVVNAEAVAAAVEAAGARDETLLIEPALLPLRPPALVIQGGSFVGNVANTASGGGLSTQKTADVSGSTFMSNTAQVDGGGLYAPLVLAGEPATVSAGNLYQGNNARRSGGGARLSGSSTGDRFLDNRSSSEAAGLQARGTTTVTKGIFLRNQGNLSAAISATGSPGVFPPTARLAVVNSLFAGNAVTNTNFTIATDMRLFDIDVTLLHNTFADPAVTSATKVTFILLRGRMDARNNIFANYTVLARKGQTDTITLDTNVLFNAPLPIGAPITASNTITGDPAFVNPAGFDYHIGSSSSACNTGLNAGIAADFEGDPRPIGPAADIGFDEARFVTPTAVAGGPYQGSEGLPVALNAAGSSDDGPIASFAWDCTDDGSLDVTIGTPAGASCTYPDDGAFTVRLRVTDDVGETGDATAPVSVANVTPAVTPPAAQNVLSGTVKSFTIGSFTDPGADAPWQLTVDWGDGSANTVLDVNAAGAIPPQSHTYTAPGQRTVTVSVRDKDNATGSTTFGVTVTGPDDPPPGTDALQYLPMIEN